MSNSVWSLSSSFNVPISSKKRKHDEISQDAPPTESQHKEPPSLNKLPTELTAMIYKYIDSNSAVALSLVTKKLYADYHFCFPSATKPDLANRCEVWPRVQVWAVFIPLHTLLSTWMGPDYHYNRTTKTFLNNRTFPLHSPAEIALVKRYKDYYISQHLLPRPFEIPKEEWEGESKRIIAEDGLRELSYTKWFEYWGETTIFQKIRQERGFLTGSRTGGADFVRKWGKKKLTRRSET